MRGARRPPEGSLWFAPMRTGPRLTLLALLLLALAPASALGQAAGDDQYQDPFGTEEQAQTTQAQDDGEENPPPLSNEPPGEGDEPEPAPGPRGNGDDSPSASGREDLANTGAEPLLVALLGIGLLMGGVGLRLRAHGA